MKIKVPVTPEQKAYIEAQLSRYESGFASLEEEYNRKSAELREKIRDYKNFWAKNEMPIYENDHDRPYNPNNLHEAFSVWKEMGLNLPTLKPWGMWVCDKCFQPIRKKYIATGHDHTDYSYNVCDCKGVQGNKKYDELV